jgi:hypothetical protein
MNGTTTIASTFRRTVSLALASVLTLVSASSFAQSCRAVAEQRAVNNRQASQLVARNPGSTLVFGSCVAAGASAYQDRNSSADATAAYGICAGLACAMTDNYTNCLSVNMELFSLALREVELKQAERNC